MLPSPRMRLLNLHFHERALTTADVPFPNVNNSPQKHPLHFTLAVVVGARLGRTLSSRKMGRKKHEHYRF